MLKNSKGEILVSDSIQVDIEENSSKLFTKCQWKVEGELKDTFTVWTNIKSESGEMLSKNDCKLLIDDPAEAKKRFVWNYINKIQKYSMNMGCIIYIEILNIQERF